MTMYRELIEDYDRKRALYPEKIGKLTSKEFLDMLNAGVSSRDKKLLNRELKYGQRNFREQDIFDSINRHNKKSLYRQLKRPRNTTEEKYGREQKWPDEKSFQDWMFSNFRFETDKRKKLNDLGIKTGLPHTPREHDGMPSDYAASEKQQEQYKKWLDEHPFINEMYRQQTSDPKTIDLLDTSNEYNQWLQNHKDDVPDIYQNYQTDMMDSANLNAGFGFRRSEPMDIAFQLLKQLASPDGSPPNFTLTGNEDEDLKQREREYISTLSQNLNRPRIDTTNPTNLTNLQIDTRNPLSDNFFDGHGHERLTDRERTVDENERDEVRERITEAMQPYLDSRGNYNMGVPKELAIRTHLLNEDRRPDETYGKSNGDSIVAIIRPDKKNTLKPELNTVMLRRSEMHPEFPQPFKATAMGVDKVINAHGMSKKQTKRLAAQRRYNRGSGRRRQFFVKSEPMDIAFQLLKERKSPQAFANKKKYDSEYQKDPKRVKYREQLNAERRRRGIYGKGGKDVSHTQGGKLTLESVHTNRARHFKNKGTLRRVK